MKLRAKKKGVLSRPVRWAHAAGEEREFPEEMAARILSNSNYEEVGAKAVSEEPKEETTDEPKKKKKKKKGEDE